MLMTALAAGRGISLPSLSAAGAAFCAHVTGAYARIREQFHVPIAKFEAIEEPLGRIAGDRLSARRRAAHDLRGARPGPPSRRHHRHHEGAGHRADARRDQRRHGHPWRQGHHRRAAELSRQPLSRRADRHHGRRRQYPHPQPDPVRPGRDPLPSLSAQGNERARRQPTARAASMPSTRRSGNMSATASPTRSAPGAAPGPAACSRRRRMPAPRRDSIASSAAMPRRSRSPSTWRC